MVLSHTGLESWHRLAIRKAVGEYGIGVIFVPLYSEGEEEGGGNGEEDLPILRPLHPTTMIGSHVSFRISSRRGKPG